VSVALVVVTLASTGPARAQERPIVQRPVDASPPGDGEGEPPRTLEQARAEGFAGRPAEEPAGSMLGGLLALGPGFFVHGLGHYYTGDESGALTLLVGELLGIGLVVAGSLIGARPEEAGASGPLPSSLVHAGVFLFVGSWLGDVVGTFKGAEPFDDDTTRTQGSALGLGYRYIGDPRSNRPHRLVPSLDLDSGRLFVRPAAELEANLDDRRYVLDLGGRPWRGENPQNHVAAGVRLRRDESAADGYATRAAEGWVRWKMDLGALLSSMRRFSVTQRYAAGIEQFQLGRSPNEVPSALGSSDFSSSWFSLASGFTFNTGRRTNVALEFLQDPTLPIPAVSAQSGALRAAFAHRYRDELEIDVELLAGDGFSLFLGLVYDL
jgi:hypothetical protein